MLRLLNIYKRERNILIIILSVLLVFAIYSLIFQPLIERLSFLNNEIESKELKLRKNQKILNLEKSASLDYKKYEQYLKQNASEEQAMASLLSEIESVAHQVNIQVNDMKPRKVKRIDFYNNFAVEIDTEGRLSDILKFVYTLQNSPHLLKAENVRLEKQSSASSLLKGYLLVTKILIPQ